MVNQTVNIGQPIISQTPQRISAQQRVVDYLAGGIQQGTFEPGARLPTERELARELQVSRTQVREALTILEAERRVVRHVGRGTFVAGVDENRSEIDTSPAKLIEARIALEPQLAALAVTNGTDAQLRFISQCHRAIEAGALEDFEQGDAAFHRAIADASQNELLVRAFNLLDKARETAEWRKLKTKRHTARPERRHDVQEEHLAILLALQERDPERARQAMLRHLLGVRTNLLTY